MNTPSMKRMTVAIEGRGDFYFTAKIRTFVLTQPEAAKVG